MTHDELIESLSDERSFTQDGELALSDSARAHAASCAECRELLEALAVAAADERALIEPPPAGYWETFGARLDARMLGHRAAGSRRASRLPLLAVAAVVAACAVGLVAWRIQGQREEQDEVVGDAQVQQAVAASQPAELEAALTAVAGEPLAVGPSMAGSPDVAPSASDALAEDPLASLEVELASLDEGAQQELVRRLRQEPS
jgi:hypothetical protein